MKKLIVTVVIGICSLQIVSGQIDDKKVLSDLVNEFLSKVDSKEMHDRFWGEDLTYTSSSGTRFGKETIMSGFESSEEEDANTEPGPTYTAEDIEVKLFGNIGIVAFKLVSLSSDGTLTEYLNSGTFQKRKGQWKVTNWQATKIPRE